MTPKRSCRSEHRSERVRQLDPHLQSAVLGEKGIRDAARSADGSHLYALDTDARRIFAWQVASDDALSPLGSADGLPARVAGLAAL
jgi:hypothetical protein